MTRLNLSSICQWSGIKGWGQICRTSHYLCYDIKAACFEGGRGEESVFTLYELLRLDFLFL